MSRQIKKTNQKGFTLVEVLVAISLFLLIITVVLGGLVSGVARERESRFKTLLQSEMYTFLDRLEREVHLAQRIGCGSLEKNCTDGGPVFVLEDVNGDIISYELVDGEVLRSVNDGTPVVAASGFGGSIQELTFFVRGAILGLSEPATNQHLVLVTMNSALSSGGEVYAFRYITLYSLDVNQ